MLRSIACALLFVAMSASAQQGGDPRSMGLPEDVRDLPLAALGKLTLDCLGTVGPTLYSANGGRLTRTFEACTNDPEALADIDELLAVQDSLQGIVDELGPHYEKRWNEFVRRFPERAIRECATWTLQDVIDAPTEESIARMGRLARPGKESYRYSVSAPQCRGNARCSTAVATACAGGFGPGFLVESDAARGRIEVDPVWWLTRYTSFNRTLPLPNQWCPNFTGDPIFPYKLYGSLEMAGQQCCEWVNNKAFMDRQFVPIECSPGWYCMTYCMLPPPSPNPPIP
jgi:hypothetical protein